MFESLFSERGLSLDRLKVLIEVRDAGSIAQAAPGDLVRQSQYSRQLRELAEFFGCEVTRRSGNTLKFTEQGERLVELAREQLRALEDFRLECRQEGVAFTIGAGDSLIQWLVIPQLGEMVRQFPGTRFITTNLRTNDIVQQITDGRIDFGIIRKNAAAPGLKSVSIGVVSYVALAPEELVRRKKNLTLRELLAELPLATQQTDAHFSGGLREIAKTLQITLDPALSCQSFPQTMAAVSSGRFAAIVPALALRELGKVAVQRVSDPLLRSLDREAMLAWNPRLLKIRPNAAKLAARLQQILAI